jgi:hypothetical protein
MKNFAVDIRFFRFGFFRYTTGMFAFRSAFCGNGTFSAFLASKVLLRRARPWAKA